MTTTVHLSRAGRVRLRYQGEPPVCVDAAWHRLRDLERCATLDFFHRDVHLPGPPVLGMRFVLPHRLLGVGFGRHAKILRWREGRGWAFSDLSKRGPRHGFPHVFAAEIQPLTAHACRLDLRISGLWTARGLPRPLVRAWLRLNVVEIGNALEAELARP